MFVHPESFIGLAFFALAFWFSVKLRSGLENRAIAQRDRRGNKFFIHRAESPTSYWWAIAKTAALVVLFALVTAVTLRVGFLRASFR